MKEFLFSRSHKKHYSNAVVRMGKNNLGFSLVELIIVIAIMAVLAAVAIPVLGVFIERSKQANDQQAVRDILYAIQLSAEDTTSGFGTVYSLEGADSVPVGFIIITPNGTETVGLQATSTPITKETVTETFYYTAYGTLSGIMELKSTTVTYVKEGAQINRGTIHYQAKEGGFLGIGAETVNKQKDNVPLLAGSTFTLADNGGTTSYVASTSEVLTEALNNAFGSDWSNIELKSKKWSNDGSTRLYASTQMQENWARMITMMGSLGGIYAIGGILMDEDDMIDMVVDSVAPNPESQQYGDDGKITIKYVTKDEFMNIWTNPYNTGSDPKNSTFGFTSSQEYTYTAVRAAWNQYFADYIVANGANYQINNADGSVTTHADYAGHAAEIAAFMDGTNALNTNYRVITREILSSNSKLITAKGCACCLALYDQYLEEASDTNSANYQTGSAFYETLMQAANASTSKPNNVSYKDYFNDYMNQLDGMYSAISAKLAAYDEQEIPYIVINVMTTSDGKPNFEVIPESADPRNK